MDHSGEIPGRWSYVKCVLERAGPFAHPDFEPSPDVFSFVREDFRVLVVGAGGLGCELLKNLALMGIKNIDVIDMDTIDVSNLNRQFLFRRSDVGKPKAEVAAKFINARIVGANVIPHYKMIQDYDTSFYGKFHIIVCGLDSIVARRWLNGMLLNLLRYDDEGELDQSSVIPLVDGGTEGFKGNARVIVPGISACIECTLDLYPPQVNFPLCTIAHTPRLPEHCVEFVRVLLWPKENPFGEDVQLDGDEPSHVAWVYEKSLERAAQFGITGVTYRLTQGVVKHIIAAVASTNAVIAASVATEVFKLATSCAPALSNYMVFNQTDGVYTYTFEAEKRADCLGCSRIPQPLVVDSDETLGKVVDRLIEMLQLKQPGIRAVINEETKTLYMSSIPSIERQTKPNLKKTVKELGIVTKTELIVVDSTSPNGFMFNVTVDDKHPSLIFFENPSRRSEFRGKIFMAAGSEPSRLLLGPDNAKHPVRLRPPPGFVATLKRIPLFHILMFISFFVSGVFVNFCQLILWLTVRPLSLDGYRRVNKHLNYAIWSQITFLFEWWSSMKIILESRAPSHAVIGNRNGLILMNHSYGIDGPVSWAIADHYGILGNAKVLAKKELLFAPVIGWSWFFAEVLFMERDWTKDHFVLEERVGSLCSWPEPFWLLLYPEGTRFTRQKHAAAVEFARSKNLPVFKHLLQPRPKGFQFLRRNIKDHVKDVYDVLMVFEDDRESQRSRVNLASLLRGEPSVCRVFMRHYKIEEIPEDEEGAKGWLMDRFVEKDALFDHFKKHGEFLPEEEKREQNVVAVPMRRTWSSLLNILFWFGAVHSYIWSHVISSLLDGSYVLPGIFVALIFAASYGMDRMVGLTSMKKSSSYGVKPSSGAVRENADAQNAAAKPGAQPVVANNS